MTTPRPAAAQPDGYRRGVRIMGVGIAATGLLTFLYFSAAGHALSSDAYSRVALLWAVLFSVMSVFYRPVEQLLSRTIAQRRAQGHTGAHPLRRAAVLQAGFAALFLTLALVFRKPLTDGLFDGEDALFWILTAASLAYAASYFARGYLAGHQWFALYGGLVFFEATARLCFPLAVLAGLASGEIAVALGIVAAPLASLVVVPAAIVRHQRTVTGDAAPPADSARSDAGFAGSVALVQLSEQALLNAAVLLVGGGAAPGIVFSALMIARAQLQLFQAIQTSLLPHLAGLEATEGHEAFARAIRQTVRAIAAFATAVAGGLLLLGPWAVSVIFDADRGAYDRGLALLGVGMGLHLVAGTFTQAALARGRAHQAAAAWLVAAAGFVAWMALSPTGEAMRDTEIGYAGATAVLCAALWAIYRAGTLTAPR